MLAQTGTGLSAPGMCVIPWSYLFGISPHGAAPWTGCQNQLEPDAPFSIGILKREPTNQTDAASNRPLDIAAMEAQFEFAPDPRYSGRHYRRLASATREEFAIGLNSSVTSRQGHGNQHHECLR